MKKKNKNLSPVIRKKSDEEENINVYREGRVLYFFDEVDEDSVCRAIMHLDKMEMENKKEITIKLDCEGGSCYDGLALYDRIRQSPCHIKVIGTGLVASMGLIIFLAGDERIVTESTRLLNHQVSVEDFCGRAIDFKIEQKEVDELNHMINEIISERTGQSLKKIENEILPGDKWINAQFAVDNGYADEMIKNTRTYRRKKKENN